MVPKYSPILGCGRLSSALFLPRSIPPCLLECQNRISPAFGENQDESQAKVGVARPGIALDRIYNVQRRESRKRFLIHQTSLNGQVGAGGPCIIGTRTYMRGLGCLFFGEARATDDIRALQNPGVSRSSSNVRRYIVCHWIWGTSSEPASQCLSCDELTRCKLRAVSTATYSGIEKNMEAR